MVNPFYNRQWRHAALWELHNIVDPIVEKRERDAAATIARLSEYYKI